MYLTQFNSNYMYLIQINSNEMYLTQFNPNEMYLNSKELQLFQIESHGTKEIVMGPSVK